MNQLGGEGEKIFKKQQQAKHERLVLTLPPDFKRQNLRAIAVDSQERKRFC